MKNNTWNGHVCIEINIYFYFSEEYGKSKEVQHTHTIKISPKHERNYQEASTSRDTLTPSSNGTVKHGDDMYLSPSAASHPQPMITLQQPPLLNHSVEKISPSRPLMNARTRHQKILQRQMSENQLSPFTLTNEKLEAIVIHDIVPRPTRAAAVQRTETVESVESISDSEDPAAKSWRGIRRWNKDTLHCGTSLLTMFYT